MPTMSVNLYFGVEMCKNTSRKGFLTRDVHRVPLNPPQVSQHAAPESVTVLILFKGTGVRPAGSTSPTGTEPPPLPETSPFPTKTNGAPDRLSPFPSLQACSDLPPRCTALINTPSTCHQVHAQISNIHLSAVS